MQKSVGICPLKLLLLAFSATRFAIASNDGNSVENLLLEMLSTCRGNFRPVVSGGDGGRILPRLLKLTSRMMMLPDDIISDGNPPDSELCDRFRRSKPGSLPRAGDMLPFSFLEANRTSVTMATLLTVLLQVMPSHEQQSVPSRHDAARPPSCESPARNWRRQLLSCSVQQLVEDAEESISTRTRQRIDMDNLLLLLLLLVVVVVGDEKFETNGVTIYSVAILNL